MTKLPKQDLLAWFQDNEPTPAEFIGKIQQQHDKLLAEMTVCQDEKRKKEIQTAIDGTAAMLATLKRKVK